VFDAVAGAAPIASATNDGEQRLEGLARATRSASTSRPERLMLAWRTDIKKTVHDVFGS